MPANPTRAGHTFAGWYLIAPPMAGGVPTGGQFTATTPVTANITVHARWLVTIPEVEIGGPDYDEITFPQNPGSPTPDPEDVEVDEDNEDNNGEITIVIPPPNEDHYFHNDVVVRPPDGYTIVEGPSVGDDGRITVVIMKPRVTFYMGGGLCTVSQQSRVEHMIPYGTQIGADRVPQPEHQVSGFTFMGWRENSIGPLLLSQTVANLYVSGERAPRTTFVAVWRYTGVSGGDSGPGSGGGGGDGGGAGGGGGGGFPGGGGAGGGIGFPGGGYIDLLDPNVPLGAFPNGNFNPPTGGSVSNAADGGASASTTQSGVATTFSAASNPLFAGKKDEDAPAV
jgi:hypothetical protein